MSSVIISGDTSGAITLAAPSVAGTNTITLPAQTGTIGLDGPAFSAYRTATQAIVSSTWTKIQYNVEEFDTANCYDPTTNYRFTPTVAGYYQISAAWANSNNASWNYISIYKNGVANKTGVFNGTNGVGAVVSGLIYFNGSTDYVEGFYLTDGGSISGASSNCFFTGALVRGA
jgi:hypothetical protein